LWREKIEKYDIGKILLSMDSQKKSALFNEMAKLNRGTRRRLLRRTTKKYKESLKQWQKWRNATEYVDALKYNPEAYHKTVELWEKIKLMRQQTIWFDEDQASKFDKKHICHKCYNCTLQELPAT
jgi:hypothetical protein